MAKKNEEVKVCSFCGQSISEDSDIKLIKAPKYTGLANDVYICSACIKGWSSIIEEEEEDEDENLEGIPDYKNLKPSQIKAKLDEYIIGQDYTKETLAAAVYNHYKMIKYRANKKNTIEVEKSNILMVGPTGSGRQLYLYN